MRILVVEDDQLTRESVAAIVETRGHDVTAVRTAEEGWSAYQADPFPILVLDWMLPGMDGPDLCQLVRASPDGDLPVILLLTARSQADDMTHAFHAGADDFLPKPFDLVTLEVRLEIAESRVRNRLELRRIREERTQLLIQAESERAHRRFYSLLEAAPDAVVTVNGSGAIELVNAQTERLFGYSRAELMGQQIETLVPERFRAEHVAFRRAYRTDPRPRSMGADLALAGRRKDGSEFPIEISLSPLATEDELLFTAIIRDISARKLAEQALRDSEERLRQAQKMEAVGVLAGGIAHDFNNLLTVMMGFSDLIMERTEPGSPMLPLLREITNAGMRAANLTAQLLAFSRRQVLQPEVLDLNTVVTNMENMLRRIIGEDVELTTSLDPELAPIHADPNQLSQVILNLAANARDAMPTGGRLTIETANVEIDDSYLERHGLPRAGSHVLLAVSDTGVGMDRETRERVFEPFFTTKAKGQGTGLGLSSVYGIVKQSGGDIWAYSEPGLGTTFKIYLPQEHARMAALQTRGLVRAPTGVETVLVVEDESAVRALVCEALERQGYTVLRATGGEAAIEIAAAHEGPIDLVITDLVMPGMSGRQLAGRLGRVRPQARVLYMSGYTDDVALRHGLVDSSVPYLQKPFTPAALAQKVRDVLDQQKG